MALGPRLDRPQLVVEDRDVVAGRGLTHRAGADVLAGEVADGQDGFGLAVAVGRGQPGVAAPDLDHLGVERFAGRHAAPQRREAVARQVLLHQHPVDRRRRAEGRDRVLRQQIEHLGRVEGAGRRLVDEERRAHGPGAEERGPGGLGPAGVGGVPVQVVLAQVEPEAAGDLVRRGVAPVVQDHLGATGRAAGEEDQGGIVRPGRDALERPVFGGEELVPGVPPVAPATDDDQVPQARQLAAHPVDLLGGRGVADDRRGVAGADAVVEVFRLELRRAGQRDDARAQEADQRDLPFGDTRQDEDRPRARLDAQPPERRGEAVRPLAHLREGEAALGAVRPEPMDRRLVGPRRPAVDRVIAEVVVVGGLDPEGLACLGVGHAHGFRPSSRKARPSGWSRLPYGGGRRVRPCLDKPWRATQGWGGCLPWCAVAAKRWA